jgi:hypothetical protein
MKRTVFVLIFVFLLTIGILTACSDAAGYKTITSVSIHNFQHNEYYVRESINLTDASLVVNYSDTSVEYVEITSDMVTGFDSSQPNAALPITVKYLEYTFNVVVRIIDDPIQSISLINPDDPSDNFEFTLKQGVQLDLSGYILRRSLLSGNTVDITVDVDEMIDGYDISLTPGTWPLKLHYDNFSLDITVIIVANTLVPSKTYVTSPDKTSYFVGDTEFNPLGLKVFLVYEDGTEQSIECTTSNLNDFEFKYDLNVERRLSPVSVVYKGSITSEYTETFASQFNIAVIVPQCIGLSFSYTDANGNPVNGAPRTYGITIGQVEFIAPSQIDAVVQGDLVNWGSGSAQITYENGAKEVVVLNDPIVQRLNSATGGTDADTSIVGNQTIWFKYGNVEWSTPLTVTVIPRAPKQLILANTALMLNHTYVYGEVVVYTLIKYNVLFNNGEYLFFEGFNFDSAKTATTEQKRKQADDALWSGVTLDMLSGSSSLTIGGSFVTNNKQTLEFNYGTVSQSIELSVEDVAIKYVTIIKEPIQNYVSVGTMASSVKFERGNVILTYNNNTITTLSLDSVDLTKSFYLEGDESKGPYTGSDALSAVGTYKVQVAHTSNPHIYDSYSIEVGSKSISTLSLSYLPTSYNYYNFEDIPFDTIKFSASILDPDDAQNNSSYQQQEIDIDTTKHIYSADTTKIGFQTITLRYMGISVEMPVNILGRRVSSIEMINPPKTVYLQNIDTQVSFVGMRIAKHFNDRSVPEEVSTFDFDLDWSYTIVNPNNEVVSSLSSTGKYGITLNFYNGISLISYSYDIQVVPSNPDKISVQYPDGVTTLTVIRGKELNLYDYNIKIEYQGATVTLPLLRAYVQYDPNIQYKNSDGTPAANIELPVMIPGFETAMLRLMVTFSEKQLTGLEIVSQPSIVVYPIRAELSLVGGTLRRSFSDGSSDTISMTNSSVLSEGYNVDPFDANTTLKFVVQSVKILHDELSVTISVWTYQKLNAGELFTMRDSVSFYGSSTAPQANLTSPEGFAHFTLPEYQLYYQTKAGEWLLVNKEMGIYPVLPGTYPLKIIVTENAYYASEVVTGYNASILKKAIVVVISDAVKTYKTSDPVFTYTLSESQLVTINGVRDKIELTLKREEGENVVYVNNILSGYRISCDLKSGDNQNDYYSIEIEYGLLRISPLVIDQVTFNGYMNLISDGNQKRVIAQYQTGFSIMTISDSDIIYSRYSISGYVNLATGELPIAAGDYRATLSQNYRVTTGLNYVSFSVVPRAS